ncbi:hypothetical protein BAMY6639_01700 [Bacillus amyloliquefaciens UMAF6639]|nr:hypothetical protein BAMY6639_01700 [Bacillus amyloliquefaciens UMAF6639]
MDLFETFFNTKPIKTLYVQTAANKNNIVIFGTTLNENHFHIYILS